MMGEERREIIQIPPLGPIYDNPNTVLQAGDGFGFIISTSNIL